MSSNLKVKTLNINWIWDVYLIVCFSTTTQTVIGLLRMNVTLTFKKFQTLETYPPFISVQRTKASSKIHQVRNKENHIFMSNFVQLRTDLLELICECLFSVLLILHCNTDLLWMCFMAPVINYGNLLIFLFRVKALLTEAQNLQPEDEHPLPWYPPVCVPLMEIPEGHRKTYDHIKSVAYDQRTRIPLKLTDSSMLPVSMQINLILVNSLYLNMFTHMQNVNYTKW